VTISTGEEMTNPAYTVSGKKRTNSILGITSSNTVRFSKFFQCRNLLEIRNKAVSHHTLNASLRYLVKNWCRKIS